MDGYLPSRQKTAVTRCSQMTKMCFCISTMEKKSVRKIFPVWFSVQIWDLQEIRRKQALTGNILLIHFRRKFREVVSVISVMIWLRSATRTAALQQISVSIRTKFWIIPMLFPECRRCTIQRKKKVRLLLLQWRRRLPILFWNCFTVYLKMKM